MKRMFAPAGLVVVLVAIASVVHATMVILWRQDPVFSVDQIRAELQRHPRQLYGRTIQVYGAPEYYLTARRGRGCVRNPPASGCSAVIVAVNPIIELVLGPLTLVPEGPTPPDPRTRLRALPVLDRVIPAGQSSQLGQATTFTIRIIGPHVDPRCAPRPCYQTQFFGSFPQYRHSDAIPASAWCARQYLASSMQHLSTALRRFIMCPRGETLRTTLGSS